MSQINPILNSSEIERMSKLKESRQTDEKKKTEQSAENAQGSAHKNKRYFRNPGKQKNKQQEKEPAIDIIKDAPFVPAFMAAVLKDIFDIVILALQAISGATVVLAPLIAVGIAMGTVITWCISIFIGLMIILAGQGGKKKGAGKIVARLAKKGLILAGFTIVESLPGLAVLPLETVMVAVIFLMVIAERKKMFRLDMMKSVK